MKLLEFNRNIFKIYVFGFFMAKKVLPFTKEKIIEIMKDYSTPFHIYDEKGIVSNAETLNKAFSWNKGFREYYALKASPNPHILKIMERFGFGVDCSSLGELILCEKVGITGESIMFTSNNTPAREYEKAVEMGAIINLDDITHIKFLQDNVRLPELISFRYNSGPLKKGNVIIGKPEEAKYGLTREQIFRAYKICKEKGVKRFGIHIMVASNELDINYFVHTAKMMFELVIEISKEVGIEFEFVNLGGGIGIPYEPSQKAIDLMKLGLRIKDEYERAVSKGMNELRIYLESGRMITGPYGYLITKVIHTKDTYKNYIGVDACMADLIRPGMYGAYHHISVMGKEDEELTNVYDVVGSLCENNDKFAVDRKLPKIEIGDIIAIHDTGAHGYSMGFNYNGKLRSSELLLKEDSSVKKIRRAETYDDLFATLDFNDL